MNYGITPKGFNSKDFTVLKELLLNRWKERFGEVDSAPDGAFGGIADSLSFAHVQFWETIEQVYLNMNPNTATDTHLTRLLSLLGMTPLNASKASVDCICGGDEGTELTADSSVARDVLKTTFVINAPFTLSRNAVNRFEIRVPDTLVEGEFCSFQLSVQTFTQLTTVAVEASSVTGTIDSEIMANALVSEILNNSVTLDVSSAVIDSADSQLIIVTTYSPFRTVSITDISNLTLTKIWKSAKFTSTEAGVFITPPHTVTTKRSGSAGWTDVDNLISGLSGADKENDSDMRRRLNKYKQYGSTGSRSAIEAKLWQDIDDISNVIINDNITDNTDIYGRPAHSVHCVVDGGDDTQIATILANNVSAGIKTYGRVSVPVTVTWLNEPLIINFDRINSIFGWVKVVVKELNPEESLPVNAEELIKAQIYMDALQDNVLGGDIITQKFIGSVYRAVSGLQVVDIQCCVTGLPSTIPTKVAGTPWAYDVDTYSSGWQNDKVIVAPYDRVEWRDGYNRIVVEGLL